MGELISLKKDARNGSSDNFNISNSLGESSCLPFQNKEETKEAKAGLKTTLQIKSMNVVPLPPIEQRGKKTVKIEEKDFDRTAMNKKIGNDAGLLQTTRSVSTNIYVQDNQHRPASLFFRCMHYAIHFFIYFLSIACSVLPQLQLPSLKLSTFFKKAK